MFLNCSQPSTKVSGIFLRAGVGSVRAQERQGGYKRGKCLLGTMAYLVESNLDVPGPPRAHQEGRWREGRCYLPGREDWGYWLKSLLDRVSSVSL